MTHPVFLIQPHLRDIEHEYSAEFVGDLNIVRSTQRLTTQIFEIVLGYT